VKENFDVIKMHGTKKKKSLH